MSTENKSATPRVLKKLGLRYVTDQISGIARKARGRTFIYLSVRGQKISDEGVLRRIRALVIPPAWTDVWICPTANGHLQATGRDLRKRKQYRYHTRFRELRDSTKFERTIEFARALPALRSAVKRDLKLKGLPKERVLAALIRLLEETHIRVGNEEYARQNQSFGLTTLRDRHVKFSGSQIHFIFRGKSRKDHDILFRDPLLAKIVRRCQEIPGQQLFQFIGEDGRRHSIGSQDINCYIRDKSRDEFTAKDFRTWNGTVLAALELEKLGKASNETAAKRNIVKAVCAVSADLRNLPSTCRKYYIHPAIIEAYLNNSLFSLMRKGRKASGPRELDRDERAVLHVLKSAERG